jgi:addiction module HigA family antidote
MAIRIEDVAGTDFSDVAGTERIGPVTPGDVLREEFMVPLGLSARALARELGVPSNRITAILAGDCGITAETAILLGGRFGTSAEFWLAGDPPAWLPQPAHAACGVTPWLDRLESPSASGPPRSLPCACLRRTGSLCAT